MRRRRPCRGHRAAAASRRVAQLVACIARCAASLAGDCGRHHGTSRSAGSSCLLSVPVEAIRSARRGAVDQLRRRRIGRSQDRQQFRRVGEPGAQLAQGHGAHAETAVALGIVGQRLQALDGMAEVGQHGTHGRDQRGGGGGREQRVQGRLHHLQTACNWGRRCSRICLAILLCLMLNLTATCVVDVPCRRSRSISARRGEVQARQRRPGMGPAKKVMWNLWSLPEINAHCTVAQSARRRLGGLGRVGVASRPLYPLDHGGSLPAGVARVHAARTKVREAQAGPVGRVVPRGTAEGGLPAAVRTSGRAGRSFVPQGLPVTQPRKPGVSPLGP